MPYNSISDKDKQRLIQCHENGDDYQDLAKKLNIKYNTAYAIVKRGYVSKPRGGRKPGRTKITPELQAAAVQLVEEHPDYTLNQLNAQLRLRLPNELPICR